VSYPSQIVRTKRLQRAVMASLGQITKRHLSALLGEWKECRRDLIGAIAQTYKLTAPTGKWNVHGYRTSGAKGWLTSFLQRRMAMFQATSTAMMRQAFKDIKKKSALQHAWLLDQVTPGHNTVRTPDNIKREALSPIDPEIWVDRWAQWVESYEHALAGNIAMHAVNEGDLAGAIDEVDATRMNTPASTLERALTRLVEFKSYESIALGEDEIAEMNDDLIQEEIWMTSGRKNICEDCADNEGKTVDEADGDIPLHPNCECFWEMHPKSYGNLLRSGNPEDRELANEMDQRGLDNGSLVIRGADGEISAKAIVTFSAWMAGTSKVLSGGMR